MRILVFCLGIPFIFIGMGHFSDVRATPHTEKSRPSIKALEKMLKKDAAKIGKENAKKQLVTLKPVLQKMEALSPEEQQKLGTVFDKDLEGPSKEAFDPLALPQKDQPISQSSTKHKTAKPKYESHQPASAKKKGKSS